MSYSGLIIISLISLLILLIGMSAGIDAIDKIIQKRFNKMSAQKKISRHRLQVMVPTEIYKSVESIAHMRNCSVTLVVIQALLKRIREESKTRAEIDD